MKKETSTFNRTGNFTKGLITENAYIELENTLLNPGLFESCDECITPEIICDNDPLMSRVVYEYYYDENGTLKGRTVNPSVQWELSF